MELLGSRENSNFSSLLKPIWDNCSGEDIELAFLMEVSHFRTVEWCWIIVASSGDGVLWRATIFPCMVCLGSWFSICQVARWGFHPFFLRKSACPSMRNCLNHRFETGDIMSHLLLALSFLGFLVTVLFFDINSLSFYFYVKIKALLRRKRQTAEGRRMHPDQKE